ncbi:hypothetical protein [Limimaricola cinnabarinus]|jgi:hypothetical protein|uniref:TnsA endonuclease N-terminal domain-containing protein n=1 Tax=Limimaricola cinnabarinus TaxID=1125964 RepID=A0A2G1MJ21_9RHOB|nr:hypothetical protein [Limimaricola cinnabarinus]PHP28687.1 hypothetical protein CJ301_05670 [Limimaricola cinnabarinus]
MILDNDEWRYSPLKYKRQTAIQLGQVRGVLPYTGVRNPLSASHSSHKVMLTYRVPANDNQPKIGLCDSAAELAVAHDLLMHRDTYDLEFQPCTVKFKFDGALESHTYDFRLTLTSGERRLIYVRYRESLKRPRTKAQLLAIVAATPASEGHRVLVVDADSYSRPRRDNLRRMRIALDHPDDWADEVVFDAACHQRNLWLMRDLIAAIDLEPWRSFQSILRLIGRGQIKANLDQVVGYHSRIWWPE